MPTGPEVVRRLAVVMAEPLRVIATGKILRQCHPPLFAKSPQGGGKNAEQASPTHIVNLIIATAAADPISDAPFAISQFRDLVVSEQATAETLGQRTENYLAPVKSGTLEPLLRTYGQSLGQRLDGLVTALQLPENQQLRGLFRASDFNVRLVLGNTPRASITLSLKQSDSKKQRTERTVYAQAQRLLKVDQHAIPHAQLEREVVIPFGLLDEAIDLWDDSLTKIAPATAKPTRLKRKTAANLAGRAAGADQPKKLRTKSALRDSDDTGPGAFVSTRKTAIETEFLNDCFIA